MQHTQHHQTWIVRTLRIVASASTLVTAVSLSATAQTKPLQVSSSATPAVTIPQLTFGGPPLHADGQPATLPATAEHAPVDLRAYSTQISGDTAIFDRTLIDSLRTQVAQRGEQWMARLTSPNAPPVEGLALDPAAQLAISLSDERAARHYFDERLKESGLSIDDKAYTLRKAISAFAELGDPAHMAVAESYLKQLDAMGPSVITAQYRAHLVLAMTYEATGQTAHVTPHVQRAIELAKRMGYEDRWRWLYQFPYAMLADALAGQPNGRAQLDAISKTLLKTIEPTPAEIAADTTRRLMRFPQEALQTEIRRYELLGLPAPPLQAHVWFNRPGSTYSATPTATSLADGKIHVLEFGDKTCPYCMAALPAVNWLQTQFPKDQVEVTFVTEASGYWGINLVSAEDEVADMRQFYLGTHRLSIPVAVWVGPKETTDVGGELPVKSPNPDAYRMVGRPLFVIIDGHGTIRRISTGWASGKEQQLKAFVNFLRAEAGQQHTAPPVPHVEPDGKQTTPTNTELPSPTASAAPIESGIPADIPNGMSCRSYVMHHSADVS